MNKNDYNKQKKQEKCPEIHLTEKVKADQRSVKDEIQQKVNKAAQFTVF